MKCYAVKSILKHQHTVFFRITSFDGKFQRISRFDDLAHWISRFDETSIANCDSIVIDVIRIRSGCGLRIAIEWLLSYPIRSCCLGIFGSEIVRYWSKKFSISEKYEASICNVMPSELQNTRMWSQNSSWIFTNFDNKNSIKVCFAWLKCEKSSLLFIRQLSEQFSDEVGLDNLIRIRRD